MRITKKKFQDILDAFYKFSVIVTGVAMAVFAWMQVSINNRLIEDGHALHQPNFQIDFRYRKSQGSAIKDNTDFTIYNVGETPKSIGEIDVRTYLKLNYKEIGKDEVIYYIPVERYFNCTVPTDSLVDRIAYSYNPNPNSSYIFDLYLKSLDYNNNNRDCITVQLVHLFKIPYIDMYNEEHNVYFKGKYVIKEEEWMRIMNESNKLNTYPIPIEQVTLPMLIELCDIDKKNNK